VRARGAGLISAAELARSPAWLPLGANATSDLVLLKLDEAAYRAASFLDQRLLAGGFEQRTCSASLLQEAAAQLVPRAHYVFHIGHVGSTLIARLLGEHPRLFVLREPALLRSLAAGGSGLPPLAAVLALLSRTWRSEQRAVIKVTSFVNELARSLLAAVPDAAAVCLFVQPLQYLRGILAGPNSRAELQQLASARWQRLLTLAGGIDTAVPDSEGERIAMSWLCEMATLREALHDQPARALWLDFDAFLQAPAPHLSALMRACGVTLASAQIEQLLQGALMRQYSKAPEYPYDAALRREVLASADHEHATEIGRGMRWLAAATDGNPRLQALIK
jgi:hypothetical protein